MINLHFFFLTLFTSGVLAMAYKDYATQKGWSIAKWFETKGGLLKSIAMLAIFGSMGVAFLYIKWYVVLAGLPIGLFISLIIINIFRKHAQPISILLFLLSWVFLLI